MIKENYDLVVIGAGPAGLGAAIEAKRSGIKSILLIDREKYLGGILGQCIHPGFGLQIFKKELTGPEYARIFIDQLLNEDIDVLTDTMVTGIAKDRSVMIINPETGPFRIQTKALILAMGCRERTRGALNIPGTRPSGIFTAGTAQRFINIEGYMPGKKALILGSGDIGLIMARRMTLEGAKVEMVCELMSYPGGLTRNIVQCLDDYEIPLLLGHTVSNIHGTRRLEGVTVTDGRKEFYVGCDTLLLSVGLIPENELSKNAQAAIDPATLGPVVNEAMQTSVEWIFACGNVLHVHDLADNVTLEAQHAGRSAAMYIKGGLGKESGERVSIKAGYGIKYVLPQLIDFYDLSSALSLSFRVMRPAKDTVLILESNGHVLFETKKELLLPGEMGIQKLPSSVTEDMKGRKDLILRLDKVRA